MAVFEIFFWNLLVAGTAGLLLSGLGAQMFFAGSQVRPLVLTQGSLFILLLFFAIGLGEPFYSFKITNWTESTPWSLFLGAALTWALLEFGLSRHFRSKRNKDKDLNLDPPISIFLILFAATQGLNEIIESEPLVLDYLRVRNLVSLSKSECYVILSLTLAGALFLIPLWKKFSLHNFFASLGHEGPQTGAHKFMQYLWQPLSAFFVGFLSFNLGGFLTLGLLLIPAQTLAFCRARGHVKFMVCCAVSGLLGPILGFLFSVNLESWPTSPSVLLATFLLSLGLGLILKISSR